MKDEPIHLVITEHGQRTQVAAYNDIHAARIVARAMSGLIITSPIFEDYRVRPIPD